MSGQWIPAALRTAAARRAEDRCEYCRVPEEAVLLPHETDHIIAEQHGGETVFENIAYAWFGCDRYKGPNVASVAAETGRIVPLFNPRIDMWDQHFRADGPSVVPLTDVGRATTAFLRFNAPQRLLVRQVLRQTGRWRP